MAILECTYDLTRASLLILERRVQMQVCSLLNSDGIHQPDCFLVLAAAASERMLSVVNFSHG